jgi:CCR4-NOT transcription complex subunit 1
MVNERVVLLIVQDNVDTAREAIEKAAMDRAVREIDVHLVQSYEARSRHRDIRQAHSFWDPHAVQIPFSGGLPGPLRIKPNGLQVHQVARIRRLW